MKWGGDPTLPTAVRERHLPIGRFSQSIIMHCGGAAGLFRCVPATVLGWIPCGSAQFGAREEQRSRHGPSGDHDRAALEGHTTLYDVMDVLLPAIFVFKRWLGTIAIETSALISGALCTIAGVQLWALLACATAAAKSQTRVLRGTTGKLLVAFALCQGVCAAPDLSPRQPRTTVPRQTDLELWSSGQLTIREQLANAVAEQAYRRALHRSNGVAPPPDFYQQPAENNELPGVAQPQRHIHVTMWTATPYFEAETIDVELPFPLNLQTMKRALHESFEVIPDWASIVTPTIPQIGPDFASFVAYPGWLEQTERTVMVLDARCIEGPIFAFINEGQVTRAGVLQHISDFDLTEVEVFPFGSSLPLMAGSPIDPQPGGVLKVVPRGRVCEWEDDLLDRLDDDEVWDPECEIPSPVEGVFTLFQSTRDQIVFEEEPEQPRSYMDVARELFDDVNYLKFPEEEPARLAHGGRYIYRSVAVIDRDWAEDEEVSFVFVDLRGLACFTQWVKVPGRIFDPGRLLRGPPAPRSGRLDLKYRWRRTTGTQSGSCAEWRNYRNAPGAIGLSVNLRGGTNR